MRRSQSFIKTRREAPTDETAANAKLLIRAGYVHKEMAGVYDFLPMGKMVLDKIIQIIREEMDVIGGQELSMSALQDRDLWQQTDRWDDKNVDVWFKTALQNGSQLGLGWTHEEPITRLMAHFITSYKDLPAYPYQFQTKMRNEVRAKSGLMRGREFMMKDLYSFSASKEEHDKFYKKISDAYMKVYSRLGIANITYKTFASGGAFAKFSHEFQTISPVGEDTVYVHEGKRLAVNKEVMTDEVLADLGLNKEELVEKTAVEVGNIFTLGTRFSDPLGLGFTTADGQRQAVFMGSYGIGPSRLMGLLAEHFADDKGLVWPEVVAPFGVYLAKLGDKPEINESSDNLYKQLTEAGVEVLYDDRSDVSAGEMFADADLMGIPIRIVVSPKTVEQNSAELKDRISTETKLVKLDQIVETVAKKA